ncbi:MULTISPECIES: hypothetical protein [unclassified Burkholderia]|uniref:hypothetical protein n=1 Tax=unclassified Burkholderia TaxID=2613784 RepID=UPI002AB0235A|nr:MULTISPECIES: hypothetical protein [unclassified Burkholderia]
MAITVFTQNPKILHAAIREAIDEKKIDTWAYDKDGDFYHTPDQWRGEAWLRPYEQQGMLTFGLVGCEGTQMTKIVYGVYHGRFIEMLLTHFDTEFSNASATALQDSVDLFK